MLFVMQDYHVGNRNLVIDWLVEYDDVRGQPDANKGHLVSRPIGIRGVLLYSQPEIAEMKAHADQLYERLVAG